MDLALEYRPLGACGLLLPCPVMPGAQATAFQSPRAGNSYPLLSWFMTRFESRGAHKCDE
jgi:hypothetical protein